mgnify:CR=1 FL=1
MATATTAAKAASDEKELLISGSEAVAEGLALADIDVVTGYPIRPYDTVIQAIAKKISGGQLVASGRQPLAQFPEQCRAEGKRQRSSGQLTKPLLLLLNRDVERAAFSQQLVTHLRELEKVDDLLDRFTMPDLGPPHRRKEHALPPQ